MAQGKLLSIRGTVRFGRPIRQRRGNISLPAQQQLEGTFMTDRSKIIRFQALIEGTPNGPAVKKLVLEPTADDSLQSHDLRSVPLGDILTAAARAVALNTTQTETGIRHTPLGDGRSHLAGTLAQLKKGRIRLTPEFLQQVADVYNDADTGGRFPTKAVIDAFGQSRDRVKYWILRARKLDLIPPRGRGRPARRVE